MTYTVQTFSTPDTERVSSVGDGRWYGSTSIEVHDADGNLVAHYENRRGGFGGGEARAMVDGFAYYGVHKRTGFRTLRAWFVNEIAVRYGVKAT